MINEKKMKRHILDLLAQRSESTVPAIVNHMRKSYYTNWDKRDLESAVLKGLRELSSEDSVRLSSEDMVEITDSGWEKVEPLKIVKEAKATRRGTKPSGTVMKDDLDDMHERLKADLRELAKLLGKEASEGEHNLDPSSNLVLLDVVWYQQLLKLSVSHAFEIQYLGDWRHAIFRLIAARGRYPSCKLFLIVTNPKDGKKIRKILGANREPPIHVIEARQLERCLQLLRSPNRSWVLPKALRLLEPVSDLGLL